MFVDLNSYVHIFQLDKMVALDKLSEKIYCKGVVREAAQLFSMYMWPNIIYYQMLYLAGDCLITQKHHIRMCIFEIEFTT